MPYYGAVVRSITGELVYGNLSAYDGNPEERRCLEEIVGLGSIEFGLLLRKRGQNAHVADGYEAGIS